MAPMQTAMWLFAVSSSDDMFLAFFQKLPSCVVGIEAYASSHHWSRELQALGHTVRLAAPTTAARVKKILADRRRFDGQQSLSGHCGHGPPNDL
jgi:transposase